MGFSKGDGVTNRGRDQEGLGSAWRGKVGEDPQV